MIHLFKTLTWEHLKSHRLQYFLIVFSILLGVAGFSSILIVNQSVLSHFRKSVLTLSSSDLIPIWSQSGSVPSSLYLTLKEESSVQGILPLRESQVYWVDNKKPIQLIHTDLIEPYFLTNSQKPQNNFKSETLFTDQLTALASPSLWQALQKQESQVTVMLSGKTHQINVIGSAPFDSGSGLKLYQDISHSHVFWNDPKSVTRFEVKLDNLKNIDTLKESLPSSVIVSHLEKKAEQGEKMIHSFQVNLLCLSLVAFLVGYFIIYLSLSLSFQQRQKSFSLLKSMGLSHKTLLIYLVLEASVLGLIASAIGIITGYFLSTLMIEVASLNISQIYFAVNAKASITPLIVFLSLILGVGATLIASLKPALEGFQLSLTQFLREDSSEMHFDKKQHWSWLFLGAVTLLTLLFHSLTSFTSPWWSFLTCFSFCLILVFGTPLILKAFTQTLNKILPRNSFYQLNMLASHHFRYSMVAISIALAFALTLAISDMTGSFRGTVTKWMADQFVGDVYISPFDRRFSKYQSFLPLDLLQSLESHKQIKVESAFMNLPAQYNDQPVLAYVSHLKNHLALRGMKDTRTNKNMIYVSDNFLVRYQKTIGDSVELLLKNKLYKFTIHKAFQDFSSDLGTVYIDIDDLKNIEFKPQALQINLKSGVDAKAFIQNLKTKFSHHNLEINSSKSLRQIAIDIFDQTFILTNGLKFISLIVAFVGLWMNLLLIQNIRTRTDTILQTQGLSLWQLAKLYFF